MARFLRTDTNSSGGHSRYRGPVPPIVLAPPLARPVQINPAVDALRRSFRVVARIPKSHLGPPAVVGAGIAFHGPGVRLADPLSPSFLNRRQPFSRLNPPAVVGAGIAFFGPKELLVKPLSPNLLNRRKATSQFTGVVYPPKIYPPIYGLLTPPRDRNPLAHSRLSPPAVVTAVRADVFVGPTVTLAPPRTGKPKSLLRGPVVIDLTPQVFRGKVTLAYSLRGKPKSVLRKPTDLVDQQDLGFVATSLAYSRRGVPKPHLAAPTVVGPVLAKPIVTKLVRIRPARTVARILPPTVIDLTPQTKYVFVSLSPSSRGIPKPHLFPPAVVTAVVAVTFTGPKVQLTRIRPVRTVGMLRPPAVVGPVLARPTDVTLAPQKRGVPKSRLSLTAIVDLTPQTYFVSTTLVRIRPVRTTVSLAPPTDLIDQQDLGFIAVTLAPSFRGKAKPFLRKPVDLVDRDDLGFVSVALVRIRPVATHSRLVPPVVIDLTPQTYYVSATLVRITPQPTTTRLFPPTDLNDSQDLGFITVTLAPQKRGTPKSVLRLPTVIDLRPQTYFLSVTLAPSFRGKPKPILGKPTDLVDQQDLGFVAVTLAYSLRGIPKSRLIPPAVIAPVLARPIAVHLAPSSHGVPKSRLEPPTVVFPFFARPTDITLVRIRPVPTLHLLGRPTDLVDAQDLGFVRAHLAYSLRGKPKSILRGPTAIDLRPQTYYLAISLAPSRFPKPKSVLRFTRVVDQPQFDSTLLIHLAYPSKGKPKSKLRAPAVVGAGIYFRPVQVELTYSSRRRGKALLRKPTVVAPVLARAVDTTLVRIRPRRTTGIIRNPVVVRVAAAAFPIAITLAPSRFPKPKSVLRKPTVVQAFRVPVVQVHLVRIRPVAVHVLLGKPTDLIDAQDLGFVKVHLAPSRFPKPIFRLQPPTVVFPFIARPTDTTLVRIVPPAVHSLLRKPTDLVDDQDLGHVRVTVVRIRPVPVRSLLKPPTAVRVPENIPTATTFVTITPPRVHSRLKPPSVVGAGIVFRPVLTHLTYSSRGKTMVALGPMGEGQVCYGTVTGFDFAPSVCGYDEGAVVTGSDSTSHVVTGSDSGATVTGTSAAGGTVTGGDTKREGC